MPKQNKAGPLVAAIHTHFNIFRNVHEAHEGPVTIDEQIKAAVRMVRWHARQTAVATHLLQRLENEKALSLQVLPASGELRLHEGVRTRCRKCGHLWGAYEDACHCDDNTCHNAEAERQASGELRLHEGLAPDHA